MKKLAVIFIMLFILCSTAYADERIVPISEVTIDTQTQTLNISGYNISENCNRITIEILKNNVIWGVGGTEPEEGQKSLNNFDPYTESILDYLLFIDQVNNIGQNQRYSFQVLNYTSDVLPELRIRFGDDDVIYYSPKTVVEVNESTLVSELQTAVCEDEYLWGNIEPAYSEKLVTQAEKDAFWLTLLNTKNARLNTETEFSSLLDILECASDVIKLTKLHYATDTNVINQLIDDLASDKTIQSNSYDLYTKKGEFADADYMSSTQKQNVASLLFNNKNNYTDINAFADDFADKVLLYAINGNSSKYYADEILCKTDRINAEELKKYTDLGEKDRLDICVELIKAEVFATVADLADSAIPEEEDSEDPPATITPPNNGGGGGGGGKFVASMETPITTPDKPSVSFDDLSSVTWAQEAILYLAENNIVSGVGDNSFAPNKNVTREEFVKMLVNALDLSSNDECVFSDIDKNAWYYQYICAAVNNGIVNGIDSQNFGVGVEITREQMAVMLHRAIESKGLKFNTKESSAFSDVESISDYAKESCEFIKNAGIMNGVGDNMFAPAAKATRAQTAKVIYELIK